MSIDKVKKLHQLMDANNIDAIIIPTSDAHKSEYICEYYKVREWLTGFTGSAGTAVVTKNSAGLWTDSRYFIQAENELQKPFILHKLATRGPEFIDWLKNELTTGTCVGFIPEMFSYTEIKAFKEAFQLKNIELKPIPDIFAKIWLNRPELPTNKIFIHDSKFVGLSRIEKIEKIQNHIKTTGTSHIIISALDDIAWLLNLRGNEIKFNPVFSSYVLISASSTTLFIDFNKITTEVDRELSSDGISIKSYESIKSNLAIELQQTTIEIDSASANYDLISAIPENNKIIEARSCVGKLKAVKTATELNNYKNAQIRDGVAMCNFLHWLENSIKTDEITEVSAAKKSKAFRQEQNNFIGLSFETISAYGENAALPHYSCSSKKPVKLKPAGIYLIDSGAQYSDGTTDITRTVGLGNVSEEAIKDFTLVLKGHIRVACAKFPKGTKGFHIDTLARLDLWQHGKDFGHGTGHGIGYFLNVHEGPQGFSQLQNGTAATIIEPGMVITNEPGFYKEGEYGIRIENVLVCKEDNDAANNNFLSFETYTYCPIDKNLIDKSLLTLAELDWLDNYHKMVYNKLHPLLSNNVKQWLKEKTAPIK